MPFQPLEPSDPPSVGPYRLLARLGAGGMGRVYLARSAGGRTVAVKVVRAELAEDQEFRERFRREVAAARAVSGPYTAPVVDADQDGPAPWLATSYVLGPRSPRRWPVTARCRSPRCAPWASAWPERWTRSTGPG